MDRFFKLTKKHSQANTENSLANKRQVKRFPCVGITLMYSPLISKDVSNLSEYIYNATSNDVSLSGLSFDTYEHLEPGDKLIVLIRIPEKNSSERLLTIVRWCKKLDDNKYRVGIKIDSSEIIDDDDPGNHISIPVNIDSVPAEAELRCPACMQTTTFVFVDHQSIPEKGSMPLYNCQECGSTRSLIGILADNRKNIKK